MFRFQFSHFPLYGVRSTQVCFSGIRYLGHYILHKQKRKKDFNARQVMTMSCQTEVKDKQKL